MSSSHQTRANIPPKEASDLMSKEPQSIRVVIYDQEYFMRGDLNQEYIQRLALYLDTKMRSIAERTRTVDTLRVAMLAALNVADEYHQMKARYEKVNGLR